MNKAMWRQLTSWIFTALKTNSFGSTWKCSSWKKRKCSVPKLTFKSWVTSPVRRKGHVTSMISMNSITSPNSLTRSPRMTWFLWVTTSIKSMRELLISSFTLLITWLRNLMIQLLPMTCCESCKLIPKYPNASWSYSLNWKCFSSNDMINSLLMRWLVAPVGLLYQDLEISICSLFWNKVLSLIFKTSNQITSKKCAEASSSHWEGPSNCIRLCSQGFKASCMNLLSTSYATWCMHIMKLVTCLRSLLSN